MIGSYIGSYSGEKGEPQVFFESKGRIAYKVDRQHFHDNYGGWEEEVRTPAPVHEADVISSETVDGLHAPVIDIDVPLRAIPSTTPDHWHLYIEKQITWRQYKRLLRALVAAGIVEKGYYKASKARGGTHVRLPWVKKVK